MKNLSRKQILKIHLKDIEKNFYKEPKQFLLKCKVHELVEKITEAWNEN